MLKIISIIILIVIFITSIGYYSYLLDEEKNSLWNIILLNICNMIFVFNFIIISEFVDEIFKFQKSILN